MACANMHANTARLVHMVSTNAPTSPAVVVLRCLSAGNCVCACTYEYFVRHGMASLGGKDSASPNALWTKCHEGTMNMRYRDALEGEIVNYSGLRYFVAAAVPYSVVETQR